jgi:hypothetical protein
MALQDEDPVNRLATWLSVIDITSRETEGKLKTSETNRLNMLVIHGVAALLVAPGFAAQLAAPGGMDSPSFAVLRHIPGTPYGLAFILGLGGAILVPATLARSREWELVGLALLATWYLTLAVALAAAFIPWAYAGRDPHTRPSLFGVQLYLHFTAVMIVHSLTIIRKMRRDRSRP